VTFRTQFLLLEQNARKLRGIGIEDRKSGLNGKHRTAMLSSRTQGLQSSEPQQYQIKLRTGIRASSEESMRVWRVVGVLRV
jgi:hypothetical protein